MNSYSFDFEGVTYVVERVHPTQHYARMSPDIFRLSAATAEILRLAEEVGRRQSVDAVNSRLAAANAELAEERDNWKRSAERDSEQRDLVNKRLDEVEEERDSLRRLNETLAKEHDRAIHRWAKAVEERDAEMERVKACEHIAEGEEGWEALQNLCPSTAAVASLREEHDALSITVEEGREIEFEITAALAVLAGESLIPCGDGKTCPGHFGPKTMEALKSALAAWRALQEGNAAAAQRVGEAVADLVLAQADARLGRELVEALVQEDDSGEEHPRDILRRIIRERDQALADHKRAIEKCQVTEGARLILLGDLRRGRQSLEAERAERSRCTRDLILALSDKDEMSQKLESAESANRQHCLELAEKAGEIRDLREKLALDELELSLYRFGPDRDLRAEVRQHRLDRAVIANHLENLLGLAKREPASEGAVKLLALLDSEKIPGDFYSALDGRAADETLAEAAWRWLREQVGSPPLVAPLNASDAGVIRAPEVKTRHEVGDAEQENDGCEL